MTSIEFLLEKYKSQNTLLFADDFEQAKEMHKQEIIDAYSNGRDKWRLYEIEKQDSDSIKIPTPNKYYQETFVSKGSHESSNNSYIELPQQETLYTEEQVIKLMYWSVNMTMGKKDSGKTETDIYEELDTKIQSLKQPKKD